MEERGEAAGMPGGDLIRGGQERVQTALGWALPTLALVLSAALLRPFLFSIAWAAVLAVIAWPMHHRISRRLGRPSAAAALSCFLVIVVIILPAMLVAIQVTQEVAALVQSLQTVPDGAPIWGGLRPLEHPTIAPVYRWLMAWVDRVGLDLNSAARQVAARVSDFLARQSVSLVGNVTWGVVQAVLALVTLFFLLRDWPRLAPRLRELFSLNRAPMDLLIARAVHTLHAAIYGAVVVAVTQGTLGGLGFWMLGLPRPLLWGAAMTVLSLIPLAGAPVIWLPTAVMLALQGVYGKAIALALWGALVVGLSDNLVRFLVIGARAQLHPLTVIFGLLGGLLLMGPLGLLLGPAILAVSLDLLEVFRLQLADGGAPSTARSLAPSASDPGHPTVTPSVRGRPAASSSADSPKQEPGSSARSR